MLPTAIIEHFMSGRLRVKIADRRGDVSYFRSAIEKLSEHPEIAGLRANPVTGSILIQHGTDLPSIREIAAKHEVFDLQEAPTPPSRPASPPPDRRAADVHTAARGGTRATEFGLMGMALYQFLRGRALGPATENFWNAYGGMRILNNRLIAFVFLGLGVFQLTRGRWAGSASSLLFYAFVVRQLSSSRTGKSPPG
ncbi:MULTISPECIES: hypothetical protein [unclassified Sinorhizobium]|uniref:hypothetical protein n=1 Tax=unclassified Sinorhizobium TaxID=2613772 RepID=UPI003524E290